MNINHLSQCDITHFSLNTESEIKTPCLNSYLYEVLAIERKYICDKFSFLSIISDQGKKGFLETSFLKPLSKLNLTTHLRLLWDRPTSLHLWNTNKNGMNYHGNNRHTLTHWGRVMHMCINKLTIIGSEIGLSPGRRQWTNDGILLIGTLGTKFNEILDKIHTI